MAVLVLGLAVVPAWAVDGPLKPPGQIVGEVANFLRSDVGEGGIRTNDDDPDGYPVPPYFYHYAIRDDNTLWTCGGGYPGYCSVSYPGFTASVAIDAFLALRLYDGDPQWLARARAYADWILEHRTPAGNLYGNLPYSTQTDGVMGGGWDGPAIMTDKPAMIAVRLLRLYDITGDAAYWQGAVQIADVLAATQRTGDVGEDGRWPFRVVPSDGAVTQDYTSHLMPAVRLFDALAQRTGDTTYADARDRAWQWLLHNPCDPASPSYQRWEGFYEDQAPEQQTGKGDHYSAHEMIVELIARRPGGWQDLAITILDTVTARYLEDGPQSAYAPYVPNTREWTGWPFPTFAATLQYARTALRLWQALDGDPRQDDAWRDRALAMVDVCTYGQDTTGIAADGRMNTSIRDLIVGSFESWYEQNFNTVKYLLQIMALDPTLAPNGETHVLSADRALTAIAYGQDGWAVAYATAGDGAGREVVRTADPLRVVLAGGEVLPPLASPDDPGFGYYYEPLRSVLTIHHAVSPVQVQRDITGMPALPATLRLARPAPNPFNPRTTLAFTLPAASRATLVVYALDGRRVRTLVAGWLAAGTHVAVWDGGDASGRTVASGTYVVRLAAGGVTASRMVVLLK